MRAARLMVLLLLGSLGSVGFGGCRDAPKEGVTLAATAAAPTAPATALSGGHDRCGSICERARGLACKRSEGCVETCREMQRVGVCTAEMSAVLACMAREPADHWECNEDGEPAIRQGYCDREQAAFVTCAQKSGA